MPDEIDKVFEEAHHLGPVWRDPTGRFRFLQQFGDIELRKLLAMLNRRPQQERRDGVTYEVWVMLVTSEIEDRKQRGVWNAT